MPAKTETKAKLTRASRVSHELQEAILDGVFVPGAKVNLEETRERFGVSLSPMREAISRLVTERLVEFEDQRGYRIAPVSAENLQEVTRLVASLTTLALEQAVASADLEWESTVLAAFHRLRRAAEQDGDNWDKAYLGYLETLVSGCGMPTLIAFCATLTNLNDRYRRMARRAGLPPAADTIDACRQITDAAIARDGELASALLRRQIEGAGARFATALKDILPAQRTA